jgi:hypothetical protein
MGKKATNYETAKRVTRIGEMMVNGFRNPQIIQVASEWGIGERQIHNLIRKARERLCTDLDIDRQEYTAVKLNQLEEVVRRGLRSQNFNAVVGAVKLQAEIVQLTNKSAGVR